MGIRAREPEERLEGGVGEAGLDAWGPGRPQKRVGF